VCVRQVFSFKRIPSAYIHNIYIPLLLSKTDKVRKKGLCVVYISRLNLGNLSLKVLGCDLNMQTVLSSSSKGHPDTYSETEYK